MCPPRLAGRERSRVYGGADRPPAPPVASAFGVAVRPRTSRPDVANARLGTARNHRKGNEPMTDPTRSITRTLRRAAILAAVPVVLLSAGCVPQDRYDALLTAHRSLEERLVAIEDERDQARTTVASLQTQLSDARRSNQRLNDEVTTLGSALDDAESMTRDAMNRIAALDLGPLPEEVENALAEIAARSPLVEFDAARGMLRFSSDVTFATGSAELQGDASGLLSSIAQVLNIPEARDLQVNVVGHTDNVPIRRAETLRRHPSNMHLSVHRAISVRDGLVSSGVDRTRILVSGWGEHMPVVANGVRGAAENRRVEVFLTSRLARPALRPGTQAPIASPERATPRPEPMK